MNETAHTPKIAALYDNMSEKNINGKKTEQGDLSMISPALFVFSHPVQDLLWYKRRPNPMILWSKERVYGVRGGQWDSSGCRMGSSKTDMQAAMKGAKHDRSTYNCNDISVSDNRGTNK